MQLIPTSRGGEKSAGKQIVDNASSPIPVYMHLSINYVDRKMHVNGYGPKGSAGYGVWGIKMQRGMQLQDLCIHLLYISDANLTPELRIPLQGMRRSGGIQR